MKGGGVTVGARTDAGNYMLCLVTALFSTSVPRPHHKSASDFSGLVLSSCEFRFHGACLFLGVS